MRATPEASGDERNRFDYIVVGAGSAGALTVSYTHLTLPTILLV